MAITMRIASEAQRITEKLIPAKFPLLAESGLRIDCWFRSECTKSGGKIHLAKTKKIGGLNAMLAMDEPSEIPIEPASVAFAVIEIGEDMWTRMESIQREALLFHELLHIKVDQDTEEDDSWSFTLVAHDVEAFAAEIAEYGLWKSDLTYFVEAAGENLTLPFEGKPAPA